MSIHCAFGHDTNPVEDFYAEVRSIHLATTALDPSEPGAHALIRRAAFAHTYGVLVFETERDGHMRLVLALLNRLIDYLRDARDAERKREFDAYYGPELTALLLRHDEAKREPEPYLRPPPLPAKQQQTDAAFFKLALGTIVVVMLLTAAIKGYMRARGL
jgi:hypothetical protein